MKRYMIVVLLILENFTIACSQVVQKIEAYDVVVTTDVLNIREAAGTSSKVLGKLKHNEVVTVIGLSPVHATIEGKVGNWLKIQGREVVGYVFSGYVQQPEERVEAKWPTSTTIYETRKFGNWYEQAQYNEKQILPSLAGKVTRQDATLRITFGTGKSLTFQNDEKVKYSLRDKILNRFLIVESQYYEGGGEVLVDLQNGNQSKVLSKFWKLSPDKSRICFYQPSDEYLEPGIQIFSLEGLNVEYFSNESIFGVDWVSNDELVWSANGRPSINGTTYYYSQRLRFLENRWKPFGEKIRI